MQNDTQICCVIRNGSETMKNGKLQLVYMYGTIRGKPGKPGLNSFTIASNPEREE